MKTKIVYTLVSSTTDIYLEQLWVSIYSLRLYNPEAYVMVLVDNKTADSLIGVRAVIKDISNDIIVVDTPTYYSAKERSREIKTSIRKYVKGNFLFLDTDTVVTDSLEDIDCVDADVAIVKDFHVSFCEYPFREYIINIMKNIYGIDVSGVNDYYNSGAIFAKDTDKAHKFFDAWNENWTYSAFQKGNSQDQPALMKTNYDFNNIVQELDAVYNCQIAASVKYLHRANVLHFFNARFFGNTEFSPFFQKSFYLGIRQDGCITVKNKNIIANCKDAFVAYTTPIGQKQFEFLSSSFGKYLFCIFQSKGFMYHLVEFLVKVNHRLKKIK